VLSPRFVRSTRYCSPPLRAHRLQHRLGRIVGAEPTDRQFPVPALIEAPRGSCIEGRVQLRTEPAQGRFRHNAV
jgi:hypothetical protein